MTRRDGEMGENGQPRDESANFGAWLHRMRERWGSEGKHDAADTCAALLEWMLSEEANRDLPRKVLVDLASCGGHDD